LRFNFKTKRLAILYAARKGAHKYPSQVIDAFFEVMSVIAAMPDERDLYNLKGLHFEKMKYDKREERSLRLNQQFRLVVTFERDEIGKYVLIIKIADYH
jgi:proteic killer suppression protein